MNQKKIDDKELEEYIKHLEFIAGESKEGKLRL
jgi:hypothetical protein